ncbi:hypothetical protein RvY_09346 [Ramazzottius varieornatus]|uniref:U1 small nuclear ribonucleoprotein 70 kDa n=1 Tax=Ramazzottius varieornatus TaxID=947166 RepID=A0A1D1V927_RAMVA|nr:hypothetical protein RvY_09346 [Ramazzottius varieornatus]
MTACLPPNLLALFAPRDPIPYLPPVDKTTAEKKRAGYAGVGSLLSLFENSQESMATVRLESRDERRERKKREREEMMTYKLEQELARWDPHDNGEATADPFKTLFVSRLNFETSENKIRREFEQYGPVVSVKLVKDKKTEKSKGYAFIEFEREEDMRSAFKYADGKRIDGRKIIVDVERGRTIKDWKPRRLGGGRGGRKTGATDPDKPPVSSRDGENDRPPGGGPMRYDRDRDRNGRESSRNRSGPYDRPPMNRGPPNDRPPYGDRPGYGGGDRPGYGGSGGGGDRNGFQDRGPRERGGFNGRDRSEAPRDDRFRDRGGDDRGRDRDMRDRGDRNGDRNGGRDRRDNFNDRDRDRGRRY